jgi:predicted DCC family thiol-disulfide oxidoreductase YuxK
MAASRGKTKSASNRLKKDKQGGKIMDDTASTPIVYVVYDDQCPFCRNYCQLIRVRRAVGRLRLVDAREPSALMDEINALGLDIDQGMVVKIGAQIHYGADAIHILALLSTKSGAFNRLNSWLFTSQKFSAFLYPVLRNCRNLALKLMGIPFVHNLKQLK